MVSNNTQPHQNLSLHAYEVLAHFGLSMSSEALTQMHVSTHTQASGSIGYDACIFVLLQYKWLEQLKSTGELLSVIL